MARYQLCIIIIIIKLYHPVDPDRVLRFSEPGQKKIECLIMLK